MGFHNPDREFENPVLVNKNQIKADKIGQKHVNWLVCVYTAVVDNIRHVCIVYTFYMLILNIRMFLSGAHSRTQG